MHFVLLLAIVASVSFQQLPPNLPANNPVTDPARIDYGYRNPWMGTSLTVIVFVEPACQPCMDSVGFYRRLAGMPALDGKAGRLVVMTTSGLWPVKRSLDEGAQPLKYHAIVTTPEDGRFRLIDFPTVAVFDGASRPMGRWQGRLTSAQEQEVVAAVSSVMRNIGRKR